MAETDEPSKPPEEAPASLDRRSALFWLASGAGAAATAAVGIPLAGYLLGAVQPERIEWVSIGPLKSFPLNETRLHTFINPFHEPWDGASAKTGAYIRYLGPDSSGTDQFWVFSMICAHLGCPVSWFPQSGLFLCPCHGGVYYENGDHASGPPPRGLYKMPWRVVDGELQVQAPHLPTLQNTLERPAELVQLGVRNRPSTTDV